MEPQHPAGSGATGARRRGLAGAPLRGASRPEESYNISYYYLIRLLLLNYIMYTITLLYCYNTKLLHYYIIIPLYYYIIIL